MELVRQPHFQLVVMGVSFGGLTALQEILGSFPIDFPIPIVVVQHMSHGNSVFVELLQRMTRLPVRWVVHGDTLTPGTVFIAPPDRHVLVEKNLTLSLSTEDKVNFVRPSADLLFESAANALKTRLLAVVLTGYGRDGAYGARAVKNLGGWVLAQDRQTSSSFEMPMAALDTGAVDFVLPLSSIASALTTLVSFPGAVRLFQPGPDFCLDQAKRYRRQLKGVRSLR